MTEHGEGEPNPGGAFDVTSEEQLGEYRIVAVHEPDEQRGRERAARIMEQAREIIRQKGGLTEGDRHDLGLYRADEEPNTSV
jgi:hypothetical protein